MAGKTQHSSRHKKLADHIFITHRKRRREQEVGQAYKPSQLTPSSVLPPARLHSLKVPYCPQTTPTTGNQVHVWAYGGHFSIKHHNKGEDDTARLAEDNSACGEWERQEYKQSSTLCHMTTSGVYCREHKPTSGGAGARLPVYHLLCVILDTLFYLEYPNAFIYKVLKVSSLLRNHKG